MTPVPPDTARLTDRPKADEHEQSHAASHPDRGPRIWPRVVGVLILILVVGGVWLWQNPSTARDAWASLFPGSAEQASNAAMLKALDTRVTRLEQRPAPPDLTARVNALEQLTPRVNALEQRVAAAGSNSATPPPDLRPILARLDALEARANQTTPGETQQVDLSSVLARLDALDKSAAQQTLDAGKIDALAAQVAALSDRDPAAAVRGKLDDLTQQLQALSASQTNLADNSAHAVRLARLDAAGIALGVGHPLGTIADAPPALTRFATTAPPTMADLRLSFETASQAALNVSVPDTEGKPFLDRVLARLQDFKLIMVRQGSHVVIGNSTASALAHAEMLLDAGDLDGAIKTVSALSGPPAEKMAAWLANAKALQAAREALASLAEKG